MSGSIVLTMESVSKRFGPTQALRSVNLEARAGEVLATHWRKWRRQKHADESTQRRAILPDQGRMTLAGQPYAPARPQQARRAGVAMIYQELNIAPDLYVDENILLGQERRRYGFLDRTSGRIVAKQTLGQLGHAQLNLQTPVGKLSVGLQQIVEIARALVLQAKVIVFDEPTSSLASQDVQRLFDTIKTLRSAGFAIIYISHFLEEIRQLCDRFVVLRDGSSVGHGEISAASDSEIVSLMVGRDVKELFPQVQHQCGEPILSLDRLSGRSIPRDVSFQLHRGEILGIAGLVGAGRTELLRTLYGLDPVRSGKVRIRTMEPAATPRANPSRHGNGFRGSQRRRTGARSLRFR